MSPAETATVKERMAYRLTTPAGYGQSKKRTETIEPRSAELWGMSCSAKSH